mmetsp:Transcript_7886/g.25835  ORF Transcript_7886/g.25835 Transcript_7886/m.25835 type:complete len:307 (-) Transcript_7886:265-1185(-)
MLQSPRGGLKRASAQREYSRSAHAASASSMAWVGWAAPKEELARGGGGGMPIWTTRHDGGGLAILVEITLDGRMTVCTGRQQTAGWVAARSMGASDTFMARRMATSRLHRMRSSISSSMCHHNRYLSTGQKEPTSGHSLTSRSIVSRRRSSILAWPRATTKRIASASEWRASCSCTGSSCPGRTVMSQLARSQWPSCRASWIGSMPMEERCELFSSKFSEGSSVMQGSAPKSTSMRAMGRRPSKAASWRGMSPPSFRAYTSAPMASSKLTPSSLPVDTAVCKTVLPPSPRVLRGMVVQLKSLRSRS